MSGGSRSDVQRLIVGENAVCVDCGLANPDWASTNLGVFLCIECSGIHRNLGTHISKVKSVNLDDWKVEQYEEMCSKGNAKAKQLYEAIVPLTYRRLRRGDDSVMREQWIRAKYERKEFVDSPEAAKLRDLYTLGRKEGNLWKKGKDNSKWNQRYFVLHNCTLSYYVDMKNVPHSPKESLPVLETTLTYSAGKLGRPYAITLMWKGRSYFVAADTGREIVDWINSFRAAQALAMEMDPNAPAPEKALLDKVLLKLDPPVHEGWLQKQGPQEKAWKKRYFVLAERSLMYFKNQLEPTALGEVVLGSSASGYRVEDNDKDPIGFCFSLITPDRTYSLQANTKEEVATWKQVIQEAIASAPE